MIEFIASEPRPDGNCEIRLVAHNKAKWPKTDISPSVTVCLAPRPQSQCCCNCFSVSWPGISVSTAGSNPNATAANGFISSSRNALMTPWPYLLPHTHWGGSVNTAHACDSYWASVNGVQVHDPNPFVCIWGDASKPGNYTSNVSQAAQTYVVEISLDYTDTYDPVLQKTVRVAKLRYAASDYSFYARFAVQAVYDIADFGCGQSMVATLASSSVFVAAYPFTLANLPDASATVSGIPASLNITPAPCPDWSRQYSNSSGPCGTVTLKATPTVGLPGVFHWEITPGQTCNCGTPWLIPYFDPTVSTQTAKAWCLP